MQCCAGTRESGLDVPMDLKESCESQAIRESTSVVGMGSLGALGPSSSLPSTSSSSSPSSTPSHVSHQSVHFHSSPVNVPQDTLGHVSSSCHLSLSLSLSPSLSFPLSLFLSIS